MAFPFGVPRMQGFQAHGIPPSVPHPGGPQLRPSGGGLGNMHPFVQAVQQRAQNQQQGPPGGVEWQPTNIVDQNGIGNGGQQQFQPRPQPVQFQPQHQGPPQHQLQPQQQPPPHQGIPMPGGPAGAMMNRQLGINNEPGHPFAGGQFQGNGAYVGPHGVTWHIDPFTGQYARGPQQQVITDQNGIGGAPGGGVQTPGAPHVGWNHLQGNPQHLAPGQQFVTNAPGGPETGWYDQQGHVNIGSGYEDAQTAGMARSGQLPNVQYDPQGREIFQFANGQGAFGAGADYWYGQHPGVSRQQGADWWQHAPVAPGAPTPPGWQGGGGPVEYAAQSGGVQTQPGGGAPPPQHQTFPGLPGGPGFNGPGGAPPPNRPGGGFQGGGLGGGLPGGGAPPPQRGGGLPLDPQFESQRRALEDQLQMELMQSGVSRQDVQAQLQQLTQRLASDRGLALNRSDASDAGRGMFNSGVRLQDEAQLNQGFDRQRQDATQNALQQMRGLDNSDAQARQDYSQGLVEAMLGQAHNDALSSNSPVGSTPGAGGWFGNPGGTQPAQQVATGRRRGGGSPSPGRRGGRAQGSGRRGKGGK